MKFRIKPNEAVVTISESGRKGVATVRIERESKKIGAPYFPTRLASDGIVCKYKKPPTIKIATSKVTEINK